MLDGPLKDLEESLLLCCDSETENRIIRHVISGCYEDYGYIPPEWMKVAATEADFFKQMFEFRSIAMMLLKDLLLCSAQEHSGRHGQRSGKRNHGHTR
jgi:hypothetical protein